MNARNHLEPTALIPEHEAEIVPTEHEVAQSQAISLKRIADALTWLSQCATSAPGCLPELRVHANCDTR